MEIQKMEEPPTKPAKEFKVITLKLSTLIQIGIALILILAVIFLTVNKTPEVTHAKAEVQLPAGFMAIDEKFKTGDYVTVVNMFGCEYILMKMGDNISLTHKGDCNNPIHKK